jgi:hypothetical protein
MPDRVTGIQFERSLDFCVEIRVASVVPSTYRMAMYGVLPSNPESYTGQIPG